MKRIQRVKDVDFSGFYCTTCNREIKKAYSIDGLGSYGSTCILTKLGYKYEKQIKKEDSLIKIWDKIINSPKMYNLNEYIKIHGSVENVQSIFFEFGGLR